MIKRVVVRPHRGEIAIIRRVRGIQNWNEYPNISGKNRKNIMRILSNPENEVEKEEVKSSTGQLLYNAWFVGKR